MYEKTDAKKDAGRRSFYLFVFGRENDLFSNYFLLLSIFWGFIQSEIFDGICDFFDVYVFIFYLFYRSALILLNLILIYSFSLFVLCFLRFSLFIHILRFLPTYFALLQEPKSHKTENARPRDPQERRRPAPRHGRDADLPHSEQPLARRALGGAAGRCGGRDLRRGGDRAVGRDHPIHPQELPDPGAAAAPEEVRAAGAAAADQHGGGRDHGELHPRHQGPPRRQHALLRQRRHLPDRLFLHDGFCRHLRPY